MELSPFLSVSVREKNHFMKCQWGEWLIFGGGGREKDFGSKYILFIYHKFNWFNWFNSFKSSIGSIRSKVQFLSLTPSPKRET